MKEMSGGHSDCWGPRWGLQTQSESEDHFKLDTVLNNFLRIRSPFSFFELILPARIFISIR